MSGISAGAGKPRIKLIRLEPELLIFNAKRWYQDNLRTILFFTSVDQFEDFRSYVIGLASDGAPDSSVMFIPKDITAKKKLDLISYAAKYEVYLTAAMLCDAESYRWLGVQRAAIVSVGESIRSGSRSLWKK